jgi:DivIVA domain-containing protein
MADERRYNAPDGPVTAEEVAHRGFATTFRGFDPNEVRQYLLRVAESLRAARDRQRELEHAVREAEARAAKPVLDEATITNALGEHTARIIRSAHEAAADIRAKAEESVEHILREAHEEAARLRSEAERALADRVGEAEVEANAIRQAAEADGQGVRRRGQEQADRLLERARAQSKEMAAEATALRNRVLGDLMRRRRVALVQVEQLQAGRDQLVEAYRVVRRTLDEATEALQRAEADARAAAEAAGHRIAAEPEPSPEELGLGGIEAAAAVAQVVVGEGPLEAGDDAAESDLNELGAEVAIAVSADPSPAPKPAEKAEAPVFSRQPDELSSVRVLRPVKDEPAASAAPTTDENDVEAEPIRPALKVVQPPSDVESVRVFRADAPPPSQVEAPAPEPPRAKEKPKKAPPEPAVEPEAEPVAEARPEVDELFAKLRAGQDDDAAAAAAATSEPVPDAPLDGDDELVRKRDEALTPIAVALVRKLKRSLQDEQNEVLDRLRRNGGRKPSLAVAFPDGVDQRARYRDAASEQLAASIALGSESAGGSAPGDGVLRAVVDELADAVVAPLARRLQEALDDAASMGEDDAEISARVSAAYRDLKSGRLERLVADQVGSAFAAGAFSAFAPGTPLKWIVRDVDGQCPDCDDNALAGPTPRGEAFPTGQLRPPAHAGCRCLLAPASA